VVKTGHEPPLCTAAMQRASLPRISNQDKAEADAIKLRAETIPETKIVAFRASRLGYVRRLEGMSVVTRRIY
jgi:hypothetical protein